MNNSEILSRLYKEEGKITASRVVELARPEESSLHDSFEWDDSVAGVEYRLSQARRLIRLTIIKVDKVATPQPLIHIQAPKNVGEGRYLPKSFVLANPGLLAMAIREISSLQQALNKLYASLAEGLDEMAAREGKG